MQGMAVPRQHSGAAQWRAFCGDGLVSPGYVTSDSLCQQVAPAQSNSGFPGMGLSHLLHQPRF